jgi:hypothetical protein
LALRVLALLSFALLPACRKCPPGPPAAGVALRDAKDKTPICNATVTFVDGSYQEVAKAVPLEPSCVYSAITNRPGNYRVTIVAPGHQSAETAISVARAEEGCRLQGSTVTVELQR